jgi:hypothetical protein
VNKLTLKRMRAGRWFAGILLAWTLWQSYRIVSFAKHTEEKRADGIVVLGAAVFGNRPSPVFAERINHAIWLYDEGYAPTIIFTGGTRSNTGCDQTTSWWKRDPGRPSKTCILADSSHTNTICTL